MKKNPEITEATREAFLQAFCMLYKDNPVEKITVKEIALKAGYNRATFYNYFTDAYDLLDYIQNDFINYIFEHMVNYLDSPDWIHFAEAFKTAAKTKKDYIDAFVRSTNSTYFIKKVKERVLPLITDKYEIALDHKTSKYVIEFYISGVIPMLGLWLENQDELSIEEIAALIKGIMENGVLSQFLMK